MYPALLSPQSNLVRPRKWTDNWWVPFRAWNSDKLWSGNFVKTNLCPPRYDIINAENVQRLAVATVSVVKPVKSVVVLYCPFCAFHRWGVFVRTWRLSLSTAVWVPIPFKTRVCVCEGECAFVYCGFCTKIQPQAYILYGLCCTISSRLTLATGHIVDPNGWVINFLIGVLYASGSDWTCCLVDERGISRGNVFPANGVVSWWWFNFG